MLEIPFGVGDITNTEGLDLSEFIKPMLGLISITEM